MALTMSYYRFTFFGGVVMTFFVLSVLYMNESTTIMYIWSFKEKIFSSANDSPGNITKTGKEGRPIILLWTHFYSNVNMAENLTKKSVNCPRKCKYTSNRSFLNKSSAIVFHLRSVDIFDLPRPNKYQKWVLINMEAPPYTPRQVIEMFDGKIHWAVTYREDSDIYSPYATIVPKSETDTNISIRTEKENLVCWIVSHCKTSSLRESYVRLLNNVVRVVIYGACGQKRCPDKLAKPCYEHISDTCKFYLSFENSLCNNYVTEKLFNVLSTDMVPIVMGGENYSRILPKHSYINALEYKNPKELAKYLLQLDKDEEEFKKYHQWKSKYKCVEKIHETWACEICNKLYQEKSTNHVTEPHKNLRKWWYGEAKCFSWFRPYS